MISKEKIEAAEKILIDNGIEEDEVKIVLQAVGYALIDEKLYPRMFKVVNVQWDKTDDDGNYVDACDLPTSFTITIDDIFPFHSDAEKAAMDLGVIGDEISDWLSDTYGYCHQGFFLEEI